MNTDGGIPDDLEVEIDTAFLKKLLRKELARSQGRDLQDAQRKGRRFRGSPMPVRSAPPVSSV